MPTLPLSTRPAGRHHSPSAPPTVLVIGNDIVVQQAVALLLEDRGFQVVTAVDGVDGLRKFRQINPELVVTDITMPEMDGMGLITELRRARRDVKIIAMSGGGHLGNMDFLSIATMLAGDVSSTNPLTAPQLLETIRTLLEAAPTAQVQASAVRRWHE